MKFSLSFKMDNAAFEDNDAEPARILRKIAEDIEAGHDHGRAMDYNGNTVGEWKITGK